MSQPDIHLYTAATMNGYKPVIFLEEADVIFGVGCSFTRTTFGATIPAGKTIVHATLDPATYPPARIGTHVVVQIPQRTEKHLGSSFRQVHLLGVEAHNTALATVTID